MSGSSFTPSPELAPETLLWAYRRGYFPMPHPETDEILWFTPDPRAVFPLDGFHVSRSLRRRLRQPFTVTIDRCFERITAGCAARAETWLIPAMREAYQNLHRIGHAHSIEVWAPNNETKGHDHPLTLAGGLYGVAIGGAFFAESMFHTETDASKIALYHLTKHLKARGFALLEVQFLTPHLKSLGAVEIPLSTYLKILAPAVRLPVSF